MPKVEVALTKEYRIVLTALPMVQKLLFEELNELLESYKKNHDVNLKVETKRFRE